MFVIRRSKYILNYFTSAIFLMTINQVAHRVARTATTLCLNGQLCLKLFTGQKSLCYFQENSRTWLQIGKLL